jgi:DNA-binding transcriptional LysR family regulator
MQRRIHRLWSSFDEQELGTVIEFLERSTALALACTEEVATGSQAPRYLIAHDTERGRLVTVLDEFTDGSRAVYVVYPHRQHLPPKVRCSSRAPASLRRRRAVGARRSSFAAADGAPRDRRMDLLRPGAVTAAA